MPTIAREIDIFRERIQVVIRPNQRLLQTFHIEEYMPLEQELFAAFLEQVVERYRGVSLGITVRGYAIQIVDGGYADTVAPR